MFKDIKEYQHYLREELLKKSNSYVEKVGFYSIPFNIHLLEYVKLKTSLGVVSNSDCDIYFEVKGPSTTVGFYQILDKYSADKSTTECNTISEQTSGM